MSSPCPPLLDASLDQAHAGWQQPTKPTPGHGAMARASTTLILPGKPFIKIQKNKEAQYFKNPLGGYFCMTTVPFPSEPSGLQSRHRKCLSANYKLRDLVALGSLLLLFQSHTFSPNSPSLE